MTDDTADALDAEGFPVGISEDEKQRRRELIAYMEANLERDMALQEMTYIDEREAF